MAEAMSSALKSLSLDDNYLIAAAIDFGTTFSGYAFSFRSNPNDINMNKNWGSEIGFASYKAPTSVLTKPGGGFHSFGYEAENEYNLLDPDEEEIGGPKGYNLYRHFKMLLHKQGAKMSSTVTSTSGHVTAAIDIFAMVLKYLKEHMMDPIRKALKSPPKESEIRWVLTVPAIWTDESKGFMRQAAYKAGLISTLDSKHLLIALEPEAASVFCRQLEIEQFVAKPTGKEELKFKTGEKILIIDAGGGTVDITAHELMLDGQVKEIAPPSGGPWGGIKVDEKFVSILSRNLGADFINAFKSKHPQQWLTFMTHFERAKKSAKPDGKSAIRVAVPHSFDLDHMQLRHESIAEPLKRKKEISFNNGFIVFKHDAVKKLFDDTVKNTTDHVQSLLSKKKLADLKYILLVGGFGECSFLQDACHKAFLNKILIPVEPQIAIIRGAVLFGHNPLQICSRICKVTYGCAANLPFDEDKHDPAKKFVKTDGSTVCTHQFKTLVKAGSEIKTSSVLKFNFSPREKGIDTNVFFQILKTSKDSVMYIDEEGVETMGEIELTSPKGPLGDHLELQLTFGHTELLFEARDKSRGEKYPVKTTVDFLSN